MEPVSSSSVKLVFGDSSNGDAEKSDRPVSTSKPPEQADAAPAADRRIPVQDESETAGAGSVELLSPTALLSIFVTVSLALLARRRRRPRGQQELRHPTE